LFVFHIENKAQQFCNHLLMVSHARRPDKGEIPRSAKEKKDTSFIYSTKSN